MFKRRNGITLSELPKYLAKGYGQGEGVNYQPMIHVQDFPSRGWRNREIGLKTGRQHDYFSNLELYYHYILDWSETVVDFREQFPLLPMETTIKIAEQCGIRHPYDKTTGEPIVMTTDFLIFVPKPVGVLKLARTIKPARYLDQKRIIEKFEIERRYWQLQKVHWSIVTEHEVHRMLVENVKWVHKFHPLSSLAPLTQEAVREIATVLTKMLTMTEDCLSNVALACDSRLSLTPGQSLAVARHLIASRQWRVDMNTSVNPLEKIEIVSTSLSESGQQRGASHATSNKRAARVASR